MADAEIILRPNSLARRIGPRARVFTAGLIQRAEQALAKVSTLFVDWLQEDISRAEKAIAGLDAGGALGELAIQCARQLQSSGAAFGYPIIARIAGSLCALLEAGGAPPLKLASAHIEAIKVVARSAHRTKSDPITNATCAELEAQTKAHIAAQTA